MDIILIDRSSNSAHFTYPILKLDESHFLKIPFKVYGNTNTVVTRAYTFLFELDANTYSTLINERFYVYAIGI